MSDFLGLRPFGMATELSHSLFADAPANHYGSLQLLQWYNRTFFYFYTS